MEKKSRREKNTEYQRTYRKNHPDRIRESNQKYYSENKESIANRRKAYREGARSAGAGAVLREHRKSLNMSQQKYAEALGITQATLSYWERGIVPVDVAAVEAAFPGLGEKLEKHKEDQNG